jgi:hypothetical protein
MPSSAPWSRRLEFASLPAAEKAQELLTTIGLDVSSSEEPGRLGYILSVAGTLAPQALNNLVTTVLRRNSVRFWWLEHETVTAPAASSGTASSTPV